MRISGKPRGVVPSAMLTGADLPSRGSHLWRGTDDVGRVTTAVRLSEGGPAVGLALVRSESAPPGTTLRVAGGGEAEVVDLPFEAGGV